MSVLGLDSVTCLLSDGLLGIGLSSAVMEATRNGVLHKFEEQS